MKFGLSDKTIEKINTVFASFPQIEKAVIFGSRAKGNYKNGSDIDLTLHGAELTTKLLRKIENELDDLLLPYKIDLSAFHLISNPDFIEHILRVGQVFYEKRGDFGIHRGYVMKQGWVIKTLGEICEVLDSKRKPITKRDRTAGEYPYYGATGILDYVHEFIFDEKLVLIGEDGAKWESGEWTAFIAKGKYWVNNHAHVIRPNRAIVLDEWIVYFLYFSDLHKYVTGLTVPKLNQEKMRSIMLPIPPLPEQQRIVSLLDETFAGLAQVHANAERNLVNAREVFEVVLEDSLNNDIWEEKRLDEICEVKDGTHDTPKYVDDGIPFVTQKNIREEGLSFEDTKFIDLSDHEKYYKRSNVFWGDILISMIGANRGMACIVDDKRVFSIKNVGLIKSSENINQSYLLYFLKSPRAKKYISENSKGGAQEFIGLTELRKFPVLIPPLEEQRAIVERLDALAAETSRLEAVYQSKLEAVEELRKSVLGKAFEGELSIDN